MLFGCDVEYENSLSEFKQLVRLQGLGTVPDPTVFGMAPDDSYFVIVSRLNLHEEGLDLRVGAERVVDSVEGEEINISLTKGGQNICSLAPGFAWDRDQKPPFAQKVFKRLICEATQTTLLEGVPYSWLTAPEREFPVTIDYVIRNGSQQGDEVWRDGETYHVSDLWWVGGGNNLIIEPGAIIKLGSSTSTDAAIMGPDSGWQGYGRVRAVGSKFRHIVATSWRDDTVGADVSDATAGSPAIGDYASLVSYPYSAYQNPAEFAYVKFRYATTGLIHGGGIKVHDCVFRDSHHGMTLYGYAEPSERFIANNLFSNCRVSGITVLNWGTRNPGRLYQGDYDHNRERVQHTVSRGALYLCERPPLSISPKCGLLGA